MVVISGSVGRESASSSRPSRIRVLVSSTPRAISERWADGGVDVATKGGRVDRREPGPTPAQLIERGRCTWKRHELGNRLARTGDGQPLAALGALHHLTTVVPQVT